jgi:5-methylcytosine-specific restriction endonuclease McrA
MPEQPTTPPLRVRRGRSGRPLRRLRAKVFAEETHCWVCHRWVDQSLPGRTHPMGRTLDHVRRLVDGGDPLDRANARLAHRKCNTQWSNRLQAAQRPRESFSVDASSL